MVIIGIILLVAGLGGLSTSVPAGLIFMAGGIALIVKGRKKRKEKKAAKMKGNDEYQKLYQKCYGGQSSSDGKYENLTKQQCVSLRKSFIAMYAKTTGLDPEKDRILEIALVHYADGQQEDNYSSLVKSDFKLYKSLIEKTHITQGRLDNAPDEREVFLKARDFITDITDETPSMIVVYDKRMFDFLRATFSRLDIDAGKLKCYDIYPFVKELYGKLPDYNFLTIAEHVGVEPAVDDSFEDETFECAVSLGEIMDDMLDAGEIMYDLCDD